MSSDGGQSEIFAPGLLAGRVALVTGGGTGLGKATALELARCGEDGEVPAGLPRNESPPGGTIVNVTLSPHHGMPGMAHSGAARATVEALTRELAERWRDAGVWVTAVAAGHFETEVLAKYPESVREGTARFIPLQHMGTHAEHAWLVTLLASPLGCAFNGSTVTLDGARDNWAGPWPPPGLADDSGEVPVEERRRSDLREEASK